MHHYTTAERGPEGGWFLTFPGRAGYSFAETAEQIVAQAQDWLESALMYPARRAATLEGGKAADGSLRLRLTAHRGDPVRAGRGESRRG